MTNPSLQASATWERPGLLDASGSATVMIKIVAPPAPVSGQPRPAVDLAFVIDRSGSMSGSPIDLARRATSHAVGLLDERDRAALVVYDDRVDLVHRLSPMHPHGRTELRMALARVVPGGSTDLCAGWLSGCRELAAYQALSSGERVNRAILLTDGLANQGITSPFEIFEHASELRKRGITTTTLGMGHDFDEPLLSGMAEAGGGNFAYVDSASQLQRTFERELGRLTNLTATNLNLRIHVPEGVYGELINPFPVDRSGHRFDISIDDLSSEDQVSLIFEVSGSSLPIGAHLPFALSLRWTDPFSGSRTTVDVPLRPLQVVDPHALQSMKVDAAVQAEAALVRAAALQRKAMELDRAGRYRESRALHASAYDVLAAAPLADADAHVRGEALGYASFDANLPYSEHSRKQATHNAMNRARRRQAEPGDAQP